MYGYELASELKNQSGEVIDLPEGTIYPALRRLEREGLIAGRWVEAESTPRRRYYDITAVGTKSLDEGTAAWKRFATAAGGILGS